MRLTAPHTLIDAPIALPASKSISNRLLILQALSSQGDLIGLSKAADTVTLQKLLTEMPAVMDVGHAGTAFRFLTAFLSIQEGEFVLTGSERMKNRPIEILVEALRGLGAEIQYLEKVGFPPLKIIGKPLIGGEINMESNVSSQFISALMMIAPYMKNGLNINLIGEVVSQPYIEMTRSIMQSCGVDLNYKNNQIIIAYGRYRFNSITVEKDWSAASFWYELVSIGKVPHLLVSDITENSIQGDSRVVQLFKSFGVNSHFDEFGLHLSYDTELKNECLRLLDFSDTPDLVQPFLTTIAAKNYSMVLTGVHNLQFKETDRLQAMKNELRKLNSHIDIQSDSVLMMKGLDNNVSEPINISTYQDHRMAMSFAPLAFVYGSIGIENPEVVHKSYPDYWAQLEKLGFSIH